MSDAVRAMRCDNCLYYVDTITKRGIIHVCVEFLCRKRIQHVSIFMAWSYRYVSWQRLPLRSSLGRTLICVFTLETAQDMWTAERMAVK